MFKKKKDIKTQDVLLQQKADRRLLPNIPDPEKIRSDNDRRSGTFEEDINQSYDEYIKAQREGIRYSVDLTGVIGNTHRKYPCKIVDISSTGALICLEEQKDVSKLQEEKHLSIDFKIEPGSMPEGYEMRVKQRAYIIRLVHKDDEEKVYIGIQFQKPLSKYAADKKGRRDITVSSILLLFITMTIVLMRAESVIYFKFNKWLYLYSIVAAAFLLTRYLFGALYKPVPINYEYTPGVTIIIPCFNEEEWIERTITSCVNQDYPVEQLEVLVVDDCSTDRSVEMIQKTIQKLSSESERFKIKERVKYIPQPKNGGKREALARGVKEATHELIVFVDSDSFLDVYAIRNLVQPFQDPKTGGVSGRTDVANTYTNTLTKMQSVRYYIAFRIMKAAEAYFDGVTCLSGPLACYRKSIIMDNMDAWLGQKFLGQRATFGDDRSMTNFVLRHHRTNYQDTAVCSTIVPNDHRSFLKQQMRWKRSWLRESIVAGKFLWRKEPFMSLFFYIGILVPIAAPMVVLYNLIWVPITQRVFPTTFLLGLFLMSFLMSVAQLFLRKSSTWLYGMLFCLYYEAVLLWQMPIAWVTFWKSTWGTRMTPEDIKEAERKKQKQTGFKGKKQTSDTEKGQYRASDKQDEEVREL